MMKKKSVKAAFYAGAVILACFYLLVLWWGKNPDVGLEYRMYYLTHELSDWPGYGKLSYEPGTTEYCTTLKDKDGMSAVSMYAAAREKAGRKTSTRAVQTAERTHIFTTC